MGNEADAKFREQLFGDGASSDAGSRFPSAGAFQDGAQVLRPEFNGARKVGVTRAGDEEGTQFFVGDGFVKGFRRHGKPPILKVTVFNDHCDGTAEGDTVSDAAQKPHGIPLNLAHPQPSPVTLLAALQVTVDVLKR
jgi:hypothetical protein